MFLKQFVFLLKLANVLAFLFSEHMTLFVEHDTFCCCKYLMGACCIFLMFHNLVTNHVCIPPADRKIDFSHFFKILFVFPLYLAMKREDPCWIICWGFCLFVPSSLKICVYIKDSADSRNPRIKHNSSCS